MHLHLPTNITALKWVFCLATAVTVACVAFVMALFIAGAYRAREVLVSLMADKGTPREQFMLYAGFNVTCAFLGSLCVVFGAPRAAGSGLPELVSMLNGVDVPGYLTLRTFAFKVLGAVLTVAASLPLGYQGVMLHIGGMAASILAAQLPYFDLSVGAKREPTAARGRSTCMATVGDTGNFNVFSAMAKLPSSKWSPSLPRVYHAVDGLRKRLAGSQQDLRGLLQRRRRAEDVDRVHFIASTTVVDQVACGAAAGAASAFKAPIGGMLYLMELSTRWRLELTWRTFFSTSVTVLVMQLLVRACHRSDFCNSVESFLSVSGGAALEYQFTAPYEQLPVIMLFGAAMGLLGAMYVSVNAFTVKLRNRWSHSRGLLLLEVVTMALFNSASMLVLASVGTCMPCDDTAPDACSPGVRHNALAAMNCQAGEYNDLATLIVSPAGENIRTMWFVRYNDYSTASLVAFAAVYFVSAAWTSGLAIPSGAFTPTMLLGSCFGRIAAHLLQSSGIVANPDAPLYALLGAAGFFTGQTRMTVSLCVIMLEMVKAEGTLPFLMVVTIIAKGVADRLGDSIIIRRIKLKNLPFISRIPHLTLRRARFSAGDIVQISDHPLVPPQPTGRLIQQRLQEHPDAALFVVADGADDAPGGLAAAETSSLASSMAWSAPAGGSGTGRPVAKPRVLHDGLQYILRGVISRSMLEKSVRQLQQGVWAGGEHGDVSLPISRCGSASSVCTASDNLSTFPGGELGQASDTHGQQHAGVDAPLLAAPSEEGAPLGCFTDHTRHSMSIGWVFAADNSDSSAPGPGSRAASATECGPSISITPHAVPDVVGMGVFDEPPASISHLTNLDVQLDLERAAQVPPVNVTPQISLEAILMLMNSMALEIVPVVSPSGVYHGLLTRSRMTRFQHKLKDQIGHKRSSPL